MPAPMTAMIELSVGDQVKENAVVRRPERLSAGAAAWLMLALLVLAAALNFIDRQILSLMVAPVKRDLGLSDVEVGVLQGPAFAVLYACSALPFGIAVDRWSRRWVLALGITAWSLMTALCGFARGFHELLLARMGVGVTEACLGPTAHSLLADGFDRTRLPLAMSIYGMATSLGSGIAFVLGGQIVTATERIGTVSLPVIGPTASWHLAFLIVAVPGFALAAVVLAIMREPPRSALVSVAPAAAAAGERASLVTFFMRRRALCTIGLLAMCLKTASGYAILSWTPTFLQRSFGWTAADAGLAIGALVLTCGIPGAILCGAAATALVKRGVADGALLVVAISTLISAPFMTLAFLAPTPGLALGLLIIPNLLNPAYVGLWPAMMQAVAPGELRGRISAVSMLTTTLFGMTVGPLAVAMITQYVLRDELEIGTAIAVTTGSLSLIGALALLSVRGAFADALHIARGWPSGPSKVD